MLQLENVSKRFSNQIVLDSLSLDLAPSKTHVLIGRSGCGKSTILRMLVGLETPDSGTVRFAGTPLTKADILQVRLRIGYVIQEGGLFPHLTAYENISIVAKYLGRPKETTSRRIEELADLTSFPADGLTRLPSELSGGQRQRVSLMRALFLDPDVLLLDEPFGALDPMIRSGLQKELKAIFSRLEKTVVFVTHDLNEAAFVGDQIILIDQGTVIQQGTIDELVLRPVETFVSEFVRAQRSVLIEESS